jgi:arsenate reductase
MITIYHNPRCVKSRQGLAWLEASGKPYEIVPYMDGHLSAFELKKLIKLLGIKPLELVRKNEKLWKEKYSGKSLTDAAIIKAMATYPGLIERPIVVYKNKAVIGRPAEKIDALFES